MFGHDLFRRDRADLLKSITRRRPKQNATSGIVLTNSLAQKAVVELGKYGWEGELSALKRDKDLLIKELVVTRQKEEKLKNHCENLETRVANLENSSKQMQSFIMHYFSQVLQPYSEAMASRKRKRLPSSSSQPPEKMVVEQPEKQIANVNHPNSRSSVDALRVMIQQMGVGMARSPTASRTQSPPLPRPQPRISFEPATVQELPLDDNSLTMTSQMQAMRQNGNAISSIRAPLVSILDSLQDQEGINSPGSSISAAIPDPAQSAGQALIPQPNPITLGIRNSSSVPRRQRAITGSTAQTKTGIPPSDTFSILSSLAKPGRRNGSVPISTQTSVQLRNNTSASAPQLEDYSASNLDAATPVATASLDTEAVPMDAISELGEFSSKPMASATQSMIPVNTQFATSHSLSLHPNLAPIAPRPLTPSEVSLDLLSSYLQISQPMETKASSAEKDSTLESQVVPFTLVNGSQTATLATSRGRDGTESNVDSKGMNNDTKLGVNSVSNLAVQNSFGEQGVPSSQVQPSKAGDKGKAYEVTKNIEAGVSTSEAALSSPDVEMGISADNELEVRTGGRQKYGNDGDLDGKVEFIDFMRSNSTGTITMDVIENALRETGSGADGVDLGSPDFDKGFNDKEFPISFECGSDQEGANEDELGFHESEKAISNGLSFHDNERAIEDFLELTAEDPPLPAPLMHLPEGTDIHALAKKIESFADSP